MSYQETIGLQVVDQQSYAQYREEIAPLLKESSASFLYDFEVARTLYSLGGEDFNRVFVIRFRDRGARDAFFADPRYTAARERYFVPAVQRIATLTASSG